MVFELKPGEVCMWCVFNKRDGKWCGIHEPHRANCLRHSLCINFTPKRKYRWIVFSDRVLLSLHRGNDCIGCIYREACGGNFFRMRDKWVRCAFELEVAGDG